MEIKRKLLDIVRDKIRFKHYSISTERTYVHWIKHYIFFHHKKHPLEMGKFEIKQFLTSLATKTKFLQLLRIRLLVLCCFYIKKF